jgi:hypothetical protein
MFPQGGALVDAFERLGQDAIAADDVGYARLKPGAKFVGVAKASLNLAQKTGARDDINIVQRNKLYYVLTNGGHVVGFRTVDELRNRAAAAKQARVERLRSKGIRSEEVN